MPPTETETNKTDVKNGSKLKKRRIKGGEVAGTSATRLAYEYISDVEIYNRLMFQLAKTGKISKHYLIFKKMRASKSVTPNLNSYAAVLQTFGYQLEHKIDIESENTTGSEAKIGGDSADAKKQINTIRLSVERILWDIQKAKVKCFELYIYWHFYNSQRQKIVRQSRFYSIIFFRNLVLINFGGENENLSLFLVYKNLLLEKIIYFPRLIHFNNIFYIYRITRFKNLYFCFNLNFKLSLDDLSTSMNFSSEQQYYIKKVKTKIKNKKTN